jgi:hypothetical protein
MQYKDSYCDHKTGPMKLFPDTDERKPRKIKTVIYGQCVIKIWPTKRHFRW